MPRRLSHGCCKNAAAHACPDWPRAPPGPGGAGFSSFGSRLRRYAMAAWWPQWAMRTHHPGRRGSPRRPAARPELEGLEDRCLLSVRIHEFGGLRPLSAPAGITAGPDGNLWFTELLGSRIGAIDPQTHAIREFAITPGSHPG